jgi:hypothetical protein
MISRVFPTKTSMCPDDADAYFGAPDLFTPKYDEVHISCQFTWDIKKAYRLADAWRNHGEVKIGGVAINGESDQPFVAGMYLRKGITITSRGCVNNCSFCMVRKELIEFDEFSVGNIIQDNNILACSDRHWRLVLSMLKTQRAIEFKGGLEKHRITPKIAEDLRGLRIKSLWLACDQANCVEPLRKAVGILHNAGFTQNNIYCYVLIGNDRVENEHRLRSVYEMGAMPFAQLFKNKDNSIEYSKEWKQFARTWSRPCAYKTLLKQEASQCLSRQE